MNLLSREDRLVKIYHHAMMIEEEADDLVERQIAREIQIKANQLRRDDSTDN